MLRTYKGRMRSQVSLLARIERIATQVIRYLLIYVTSSLACDLSVSWVSKSNGAPRRLEASGGEQGDRQMLIKQKGEIKVKKKDN